MGHRLSGVRQQDGSQAVGAGIPAVGCACACRQQRPCRGPQGRCSCRTALGLAQINAHLLLNSPPPPQVRVAVVGGGTGEALVKGGVQPQFTASKVRVKGSSQWTAVPLDERG